MLRPQDVTRETGGRPSHSGLRTCLGCRNRDDPSHLLRIVARPLRPAPAGSQPAYVIIPDPERRLPGRGAHLHPRVDCLDQAVRRRAFGRAFRTSASWDTSGLGDWLAATLEAAPQESPHDTPRSPDRGDVHE